MKRVNGETMARSSFGTSVFNGIMIFFIIDEVMNTQHLWDQTIML